MRCFVEVDLVQAEWVATAYIAGDPRMLDVVRTGADPHVRTGSLISGAPEDFVVFENSIVGHLTDPTEIAEARRAIPTEWKGHRTSTFYLPRTMSIRQAGKKSNHGLNYGMEYRRFALENEMPETDARHIVEIYRKVAYSGLPIWYRSIEYQLKTRGRRLTNCFGQTRRFLERWGPDLLNAAYAFLPQSTVANVACAGWRDIYNDRDFSMRHVSIAGQKHDSVVTDHEFDSYDELHTQVCRCVAHMTSICEYGEQQFILDTEVKIGPDWSYMKTVRSLTPECLEATLQDALADTAVG